jgi:hypothetical protein
MNVMRELVVGEKQKREKGEGDEVGTNTTLQPGK